VQLFFVASAFTISASLERLAGKPGRLRKFFIFRLFRIVPLYWLAIGVYAGANALAAGTGAGIPFVEGSMRPFSGPNVAANALLVHGLYLPAINNIVPGGWSIGTEWLFYLAAPILLVLVRGPASALAIGLAGTAAAQGARILGGMVLGRTLGFPNNGAFYFTIFNQVAIFICGILYYKYRERVNRIPVAIGLAGAALVLAAEYALWPGTLLGILTFSVVPLLSGVGAVLFMSALSQVRTLPRILIRFGQCSYSIYVFHFLVVAVVFEAEKHVLGFRLGVLPAMVIVTVVTFGIAELTYRHLEQPFIALSRRLAARVPG
jgi:peptidoglycan/LPS O-acetylase OafA/YrhL